MAEYDIAIIGAGIVGSSLASFLAPHARVLLLDRSVRGLPGSTGHAPGFVGQFNKVPALTELAKRSVASYLTIPGGFAVVGGLEIALGSSDLPNLEERRDLARARGLQAEIISPAEAARLAPAFVSSAAGALHFPADGTANAIALAHGFQDAATAAGATAVDANVTAITKEGERVVLETSAGAFKATKVAICTGVWSSQLAPSLDAAVSVAHPYAYSSMRDARDPSPWIRWPSEHVYARDHGSVDGLGSYDHDPVAVSSQAMAEHPTAFGQWHASFDDPISRGLKLMPAETAARFQFGKDGKPKIAGEGGLEGADKVVKIAKENGEAYAFNGLFQVTPDGLPLVGKVDKDTYVAIGVWVTHAAGSAGVLADMILHDLGKGEQKDESLRKATDPLRFEGQADVRAAALATYNDIYNKEK